MRCPKCHFENPEGTRFCSNCASPLLPSGDLSLSHTETLETAKKELTTGSIFAGRYQVIEELGAGGMGKVYKVFDTEIKEKVALKLLKPEIAVEEKTIERFRNELKFARKISHKNVCRMFDLNRDDGTSFITMEYVDGEDLKSSIIRMGPLSAGKAVFIAKQVCKGLAEAHGLGVVHRDLKPQNIMIDRKGNVRIMDFGIARSLKAKGITGAGVMIGTPEYMSPEQVEGKEADQRSDIYSLGVILYEMVTGKVPFEGDTPFSIAYKHKNEMPKNPKELNSQISEELSRVILKCMEKDKENRFQSAGEVISELNLIEKGIPTTERVLPKKKPLTSREITVKFSLKKLFLPGLAVVILAIVGLFIWRLFPHKKAVLIPANKPSLAIMYFENNTGDEGLNHYRKAISDLLTTDLAQSKRLWVLSGSELFNIFRELNLLEARSYSSKDLREVASRGGVENVLVGSYTRAGDTFRINVSLQRAKTAELLASDMVEGQGEASIFSMVDELTRKIKANFKFSQAEIASDLDKKIGQITTSSPEALKYYSEGRKYHLSGDFGQSIRYMEKAVAIDPEFAMAYRSMAISYGNRGLSPQRVKYIKKALEFTNRLSDRERFQIEGDFYASSEKTHDKAIEAYRNLLALYPKDSTASVNLGGLYIDIEEWDKAVEVLEAAKKERGTGLFLYWNLASAYSGKGLYEKAKEVLESYLNNFSDHAWIRASLAQNYLSQGKYDLALVEVDKAFFLDPAYYPNLVIKGDIYYYKGDFRKAEKEYKKLVEGEEPGSGYFGLNRLRALYMLKGRFEEAVAQDQRGIEFSKKLGVRWAESDFHLRLAYTYLKSGDPENSLKECSEAWRSAGEAERLDLQRRALYLKGLAQLKMNAVAEAEKEAEALKEFIEKGMNKKEIRWYDHLMGMIELKRENISKAVRYFKDAISFLPPQIFVITQGRPTNYHALFIYSLASAYFQAKNYDKAREEYEKIISLLAGRLYYGDIYAKSFYMLGRIYEEKAWKGKAIEHYQKFLDLWKEADPGAPEITAAVKRLAALKK